MIESYDINDYLKDDKELQKAVIRELFKEITTQQVKLDAYQRSEYEANEIIAELQAYKDVNEDFKTAYAELKAENDRLKRENEIITGMCNSSSNRFDKLYNSLQEIKTIAKKVMQTELCNSCDGCGLIYGCNDTDCAYYQMEKILQKITKAEEE